MNLTEEISPAFGSPDRIAAQLAALGHPVRIRILRHLALQDACCCGDIVRRIDLAQSTVSQHLKVLVSAGLVRYEPENRKSRYTIERQAVVRLSQAVAELLPGCCGKS